MKKIFGILALAAFSTALLSSCQKNYTCTCMANEEKYVYTYNQETKKEASDACNKQDAAAKLADKKAECSLTHD